MCSFCPSPQGGSASNPTDKTFALTEYRSTDSCASAYTPARERCPQSHARQAARGGLLAVVLAAARKILQPVLHR